MNSNNQMMETKTTSRKKRMDHIKKMPHAVYKAITPMGDYIAMTTNKDANKVFKDIKFAIRHKLLVAQNGTGAKHASAINEALRKLDLKDIEIALLGRVKNREEAKELRKIAVLRERPSLNGNYIVHEKPRKGRPKKKEVYPKMEVGKVYSLV